MLLFLQIMTKMKRILPLVGFFLLVSPVHAESSSKYPTDPNELCRNVGSTISVIGGLQPDPSRFARSFRASMYLDGREGADAVQTIQRHCPWVFN